MSEIIAPKNAVFNLWFKDIVANEILTSDFWEFTHEMNVPINIIPNNYLSQESNGYYTFKQYYKDYLADLNWFIEDTSTSTITMTSPPEDLNCYVKQLLEEKDAIINLFNTLVEKHIDEYVRENQTFTIARYEFNEIIDDNRFKTSYGTVSTEHAELVFSYIDKRSDWTIKTKKKMINTIYQLSGS